MDAEQRRDDAERAKDEGEDGVLGCQRGVVGEQRSTQEHHGDCASNVAIEDVGAHASHVAHVVTDVVGDDSGVARIVLGDAELDLPNQVGGDIGRLRVDTAARLGQQGQRRRTEAETEHDLSVASEKEDHGHTDRGQADHRQTHDRSGVECHSEGPVDADPCRRRAPYIGGDGDRHAHVPGDGRTHGASDECQRHGGAPKRIEAGRAQAQMLDVEAEHDGDHDTQRDRDKRQGRVQPAQVGYCPLTDPGCHLLGLLRARVLPENPEVQERCHAHRDCAQGDGDD